MNRLSGTPLQVKYLAVIKERYKTSTMEKEIHRRECSNSVTSAQHREVAFRLRFAT